MPSGLHRPKRNSLLSGSSKCPHSAVGLLLWRWPASLDTVSLPSASARRARRHDGGANYDRRRMLTNKNEVLAAALDQTNAWLAQTLGRPDLQLQLISQPIARTTAMQFERGGGLRRKVHWNWEDIFFSRVRHQDAWMYAMVRAGRPRAMCYGRIQIQGGHVSLEYLERTPYARGIRGFTAPTAFQFARAVALRSTSRKCGSMSRSRTLCSITNGCWRGPFDTLRWVR